MPFHSIFRTLIHKEASIFNTIMTGPNIFPLELEKKKKKRRIVGEKKALFFRNSDGKSGKF